MKSMKFYLCYLYVWVLYWFMADMADRTLIGFLPSRHAGYPAYSPFSQPVDIGAISHLPTLWVTPPIAELFE
jgi:hypothetical protein